MTTVAFDGETLAIDMALWQDNYYWTRTSKFYHVNIGHPDVISRFRIEPQEIVWGACGDAEVVPLVLTWMEKGGEIPKDLCNNNVSTAGGLIVSKETGLVYGLTALLTLETFQEVPVAGGGGFKMALGAMLAGASAIRAIELVTTRSGMAAGGVESYTLPKEIIEKRKLLAGW